LIPHGDGDVALLAPRDAALGHSTHDMSHAHANQQPHHQIHFIIH
jgi:2C-methyl-D-erythritol 2,4-cyclodiphosphate synthase